MIRRLDLDALQQELAGTPLLDWASDLPGQLDQKLAQGHGDLQRCRGDGESDAVPRGGAAVEVVGGPAGGHDH